MLRVQSRGQPMQKASVHELAMHKAQMDHEFSEKDMTSDDLLDILANDFERFQREGFGELRMALWIMIRNILGNSDSAELPQEFSRMLALYATGTLFSALHLAAWNWEFPSSTVRELWRIFAITTTGTGPATILVVSVGVVVEKFYTNTDMFVSIVFYIFIFAYAASRIGLVVLILYCFSSMPAGVYETVNWLQFLPHFS